MQLQELKQRASGNLDEPFLNPGVSKKQPLHVVMVRYSEIMRCGLNVKDFPFKSTHTNQYQNIKQLIYSGFIFFFMALVFLFSNYLCS